MNPGYAFGALDAASVACDQLYDETEYTFDKDKEYVYKLATFYHSQPCNDIQTILASLRFIQSSMEIYEDILDQSYLIDNFLLRIINISINDEEVIEKTLEVVNRFIDIYHRKIQDKLDNVCQFFNSFIIEEKDFVIVQVFEFWHLIAELRYDQLIKKYFGILLPKLFACLTKEDISDSEWSAHKAASSLLVALTDDFNSGILLNPLTQAFIRDHLQSNDPEKRAIGAMALASVCQSGCGDFIANCLPVLVANIENSLCDNESLYGIARICEKDINITTNYIPNIIEKCNFIISESRESSENAIWVYYSMLSSIQNSESPEIAGIINFNFVNILSTLINRLDRTNITDYNIRNALNTTLSELILYCPRDMSEILEKLTNYLLNKISESLQYFTNATKEQILVLEDILSNHIVLLQVVLAARKSFDKNQISTAFTACLQIPENSSFGEIYIALSKLIDPLSDYLRNFIPYIVRDIEGKDPFVIKSALNLLSDIAIELGDPFSEFTPIVMPALIGSMSSSSTPLDLKPTIINVFGDIALSIGVAFKSYIEMSVVLFSQINSLNRNDDEAYVDALRKSVLHLFSCIFLAVGDINDMRRHLKQLLELIKKAVSEDVDGIYREESVNILMDIRNLFGIKSMSPEWIKSYLLAVSTGKNDAISIKAKDLYNSFY